MRRMLSDGIPTPAVDMHASSTPVLVTLTPASSAAAGGSSAAAGGSSLLPPPAAGGSGRNKVNSFDADVVMVLAALLSVLICALSINSIIRCALHYYAHGRRAHTTTMAAAAAPPAATTAPAPTTTTATDAAAGMKERALRRIPVVVYEANKAGAPDAAECAICLGEFAGGDRVRLLPRCRHGFHVTCIDMWFAAHSSCPICRDSLLLDDCVGDAAADEAGATVATTTTLHSAAA